MVTVRLETPKDVDRQELLNLYHSVAWSAYTRDPDALQASILGSHRLAVARHDGVLVGLARSISDGVTIVYVQDVLVQPSEQRRGIGRRLLETLIDSYGPIRQCVLLTDNNPGQHAFYERLGFIQAGATREPLCAFVRMA